MSSKKDHRLLEYLEKNNLEEYYEAFQKEKLTFPDLEFLEADDVESIIPKRVHRKRFLKCLESLSSKERSPVDVETKQKKEGARSEKEGERVHMFVKCKQEVRKIYDLPLSISNEDLITRLFHAFIEGEVKLQGEEIPLVKELKSFTLKDWKEKNELSPGKMLRAVLNLKGEVFNTRSNEEEVERLRVENSEGKLKLEKVEKRIEKAEDRLKIVKREADAKGLEINGLKKELEKALIESKAKSRKLEEMTAVATKKVINSSTIIGGFKSHRGILVPHNVVFEVNKKWRTYLEKMFSNENKVAKGGSSSIVCFKASTVFTAGKKFYFQVSANVGDGYSMGLGIMSGEVTTCVAGFHEKGLEYYCEPGEKPNRATYRNKVESSGYGPKRTFGKHKFGIFCDFTDGKGEVSFVVDGKNWGVVYKNVKPPVSPAFTLWSANDWFKIEDSFEVPGIF